MRKFELRARVAEQRGETAANTHVGAHSLLVAVPLVHARPFLRSDHLQREFVMIAQESSPLRSFRDLRRSRHNVPDRGGPLVAQRIVDSWHDGEVETHVALGRFVGSEIVDDVGRPLVRFGQQDRARELFIKHCPHAGKELMGAREILAVGALLLKEIRHGI